MSNGVKKKLEPTHSPGRCGGGKVQLRLAELTVSVEATAPPAPTLHQSIRKKMSVPPSHISFRE